MINVAIYLVKYSFWTYYITLKSDSTLTWYGPCLLTIEALSIVLVFLLTHTARRGKSYRNNVVHSVKLTSIRDGFNPFENEVNVSIIESALANCVETCHLHSLGTTILWREYYGGTKRHCRIGREQNPSCELFIADHYNIAIQLSELNVIRYT